MKVAFGNFSWSFWRIFSSPRVGCWEVGEWPLSHRNLTSELEIPLRRNTDNRNCCHPCLTINCWAITTYSNLRNNQDEKIMLKTTRVSGWMWNLASIHCFERSAGAERLQILHSLTVWNNMKSWHRRRPWCLEVYINLYLLVNTNKNCWPRTELDSLGSSKALCPSHSAIANILNKNSSAIKKIASACICCGGPLKNKVTFDKFRAKDGFQSIDISFYFSANNNNK